MDQKSTYANTEDLLLERAPSSMIETAGCSLDSWWEAQYNFSSEEQGDYYFKPLRAAYENLSSSGDDLAYFSAPHQFSDTDQAVVSYSIPLLSEDNEPYAILGIELSTKYLASLVMQIAAVISLRHNMSTIRIVLQSYTMVSSIIAILTVLRSFQLLIQIKQTVST